MKGSLATELTGKNYNYPSMSKQYRMSTQKRVYFGPWESYFLLAEAGVRGWDVPGSPKSNYENGVTASFEYHGVKSVLICLLPNIIGSGHLSVSTIQRRQSLIS